MTKKFYFLMVIIFALMPFSAASAQVENTPLGSRISKPVQSVPVDKKVAGKINFAFADCMYRNAPESAEELLQNSDAMSIDEQSLDIKGRGFKSRFRMDFCLENALKFGNGADYRTTYLSLDMPTLRRMMLEASYRANEETVLSNLSSETELQQRNYVSEGEMLAAARANGQFADCLVKAAPQKSDTLVRTVPNSKEEADAIRNIVPYLGSCLLEGYEVTFNRESVRQLVAEGLWHASFSGRAESK